MNREKFKLPKKEARFIPYGDNPLYSIVKQHYCKQDMDIVKRVTDGKFFAFSLDGEFDDDVEFIEVFPVHKLVVFYE